MTVDVPACMTCKHYRRHDPLTCDAFPSRIPDLVWLQGDPHTAPIEGDHGIRFEPIDSTEEPTDGRQSR